MSHTGDLIRKYRKDKGLTQKQLGERCGIADSNIRKYENGRQNPKFETILKIASALDRSPSDFYSISDVTSKLKKDYFPPEHISDLQQYLESLGYRVLREEITRTVKKEFIDFELSEDQKDMVNKYGYVMIFERPYYIQGEKDSYRLTEKEFTSMEGEVLSVIEHQLWKHRIEKASE